MMVKRSILLVRRKNTLIGGREMGDDGRGCRKWEEEIYWTIFSQLSSFKLSLACIITNLDACYFFPFRYINGKAIPQKFVNNLKEKLVGAVSFKGPSGALWKVGLTASGDTLYFKDGWKEFVEDHSLKENDVLIFKYIGNSRFDILMFDHESLCEKEASYFIRRCENGEVGGECKRNGNSLETVEVTNTSSHDVFDCTPSKRARKDYAWTPRSRGLRPQANGNIRGGTSSSINPSSSCGLGLTSHRRQVTEEEKEKALNVACAAAAAASEYSFIIVMRPTHVYKGFIWYSFADDLSGRISIPSEWAKVHLPNKSQDLTLQVKDKTWQVRFYKRDYGGGLAGGWKRFVDENFLEEFDVCLFNLVTKTTDAVVMDVSIFRVVDNEIPVARATPMNKKGRKPKIIQGQQS